MKVKQMDMLHSKQINLRKENKESKKTILLRNSP